MMASPRLNKRARILAKTGGRCIYCGTQLAERGWHADHLQPVQRKFKWAEGRAVHTGEQWRPELDTEANLVPACAPCNLYKSTLSVESMRHQIANTVRALRRDQVGYRFALAYGLVHETGCEVLFWFETPEGRTAIPHDVMAMIEQAKESDPYLLWLQEQETTVLPIAL